MNYIETGKDTSGNAVKIHYKDYGKGKPENVFLIYEGAAHGLFYTEREKLNTNMLYFISNKGNQHYHVKKEVSQVTI